MQVVIPATPHYASRSPGPHPGMHVARSPTLTLPCWGFPRLPPCRQPSPPPPQGRWGEAARKLSDLLNDDTFRSLEGKSKHTLWLELCDIITKHPKEVAGMRVDAIIRGGIRRFTDEVRRHARRLGARTRGEDTGRYARINERWGRANEGGGVGLLRKGEIGRMRTSRSWQGGCAGAAARGVVENEAVGLHRFGRLTSQTRP